MLIQEYAQFWFFRKGPGNSFSTAFCVCFFKKNISHVTFYQPTKFHCLITFTSWDIGQYVYDVMHFRISLFFLIKPFFYMIKSQDKNRNILRWNRNDFSSFLKGFQLPKIVSDLRLECAFNVSNLETQWVCWWF